MQNQIIGEGAESAEEMQAAPKKDNLSCCGVDMTYYPEFYEIGICPDCKNHLPGKE